MTSENEITQQKEYDTQEEEMVKDLLKRYDFEIQVRIEKFIVMNELKG